MAAFRHEVWLLQGKSSETPAYLVDLITNVAWNLHYFRSANAQFRIEFNLFRKCRQLKAAYDSESL